MKFRHLLAYFRGLETCKKILIVVRWFQRLANQLPTRISRFRCLQMKCRHLLTVFQRLVNEFPTLIISPVALQLRAPPPKVSARAPAHRSYHFRGVKLKSCIKKIHHNLYISKQANVTIKHVDTEGASHKNSAPMPEFSRTFMQTLRNESNDTEKHEKVIKTQYHLNSLERTFLFANAVMTLS